MWRRIATIRTLVLIMEIACKRRATVRTLGQHCQDAALFRKDFSALFGKLVAQLSIQMLSATIQTLPREN
jgi:hypothetical protein